MAYNRIIISGTSPSGENWSCGWALGEVNDSIIQTFSILSDWANAIAQAIQDSTATTGDWSELLKTMNSNWAVTNVRVEARASTREMLQAAEASFSKPGLGSNLAHPPQTAVVLSLITGRPGRRYRGRIYWPAPSVTLQLASSRVALEDVTNIAEGAVAAITSASTVPGQTETAPVIVHSEVGNVDTAVTRISVGDVLDTQRRRRDSIPESRVILDL